MSTRWPGVLAMLCTLLAAPLAARAPQPAGKMSRLGVRGGSPLWQGKNRSLGRP